MVFFRDRIKKTGARFLVGLALVTWPIYAQAESSPSVEEASNQSGSTSIFLPVVTSNSQGEDPGYQPRDSEWLDHLNYYRELAGLAAVAANPDWDQGAWLHSRYMVKNDYIGHSEDQSNSWYTPEGEAAAKTSNLVVSYSDEVSDIEALDAWMKGPFHNIGIIDPQLQMVGYGSYREQDGGLQMGGALDVLRGLDDLPESVNYPVFWPGEGVKVPLTSFTSEYPDPLSSCNGYSSPAGLPIILQIGAGDERPNVSSHSFKKGNVALDHCVFDENTYSNPNPNAQSLGRAILDMRDAIVLMPRDPLVPGETYKVSMTVNGKNYSWSFSVNTITSQSTPLADGENAEPLFLTR
jgi:uncharacterized protein YkwD